ncbi:MAG: tRNA (adenosine(37)-N6)-threonylcarbamoyltransferase complex dimerization subunit type 1 TsaB [Chloroflexota bacterium]|nr:tRNA (adenosine(37)-N6)-threonylcarbamoyltransferase complex dimerization subunit type 1 TsaB [Chloroflexota bacterium]
MPASPDLTRPRPLLAIDSSTEQAGVGLFDGERGSELAWHAGRTQTATLLAQVDHLLGLRGLVATDLGAIAVATGPGTFNGLRVGMGVAKGLVLGLGVPLLGVPTLAAAALPHADAGRPVVPVVAAGRGRLVWAKYADGPGGWGEVLPARNGTVEDLVDHLGEEGAIVTGELDLAQEAAVGAVPGVVLVPRPLRSRRPNSLAALAWDRHRAGEADDPASLEPVYAGR